MTCKLSSFPSDLKHSVLTLSWYPYSSALPCWTENTQRKQSGGVIWTKGTIEVRGGNFSKNDGNDLGGVIYSADESATFVTGGEFKENEANDGGVIYVGSEFQLSVSGGT